MARFFRNSGSFSVTESRRDEIRDGTMRLFWRQLARIAALFALLGLGLQAASGDRWPLVAPFTYALSFPIVGLGWLAAAAAWALGRRRLLAALSLGAAVATGLVAVRLDYRVGGCSESRPAEAMRVVSWNVQHQRISRIEGSLRSLEADVVVLVEGDGSGNWKRSFAEYAACDPGGGIVVLSRRPLSRCERRRLDARSHAVLASSGADPAFEIIGVDIDGHPLTSRRRAIDALAGLVRREGARAIVAGDFNTPRRAWSFAPLARTHRSAFAEAGRGWAATWPEPAPVLEIDHVWLPRGAIASCARHPAGAGSDHRPVVVDFSVFR